MTKSEEKIKEARRRLKKILKGAEKNGFLTSDLVGLSSSKKILNRSSSFKGGEIALKKYQILIALTGILAILTFPPDFKGFFQGFSTLWLNWNGYGNVRNEPCTVPMPDLLVKIFRPPVTCSICRGMKKIEKVSNLTPEIFEERYAYTGTPIVITDGMSNWTAQNVFGFEFFKKIYTERMEKWRTHNCQFFPYSTEFKDLSEVFNMSEDRARQSEGTAPWYVGWSNCDDEIGQILRRHYQRPYFLPETAETKRLDWIFMGSSGFGAPMHVDNVEHPSWQAQLRGTKKWSLQPPPECYYQCETVQVEVEPGEIIVLDTNRWYHSTLIVSKEISITIGAEYD